MQFLKFGLSLILLLVLVYIGDTHGLGGSGVPALAKLLNPFTGVWQQAEAISRKQHLLITAEARGEVVLDERRIPHIFADNIEDAIFIQGYMHARDRLFQMDISVRATEGRLAEILGLNALERDQLQRRKGMKVAAQQTAAVWLDNPETKVILEAYTAGVNAFLTNLKPADYPVEYKLLGFEPEPWSVYKSALFSKGMAETLCFRNYDIATTNIRTALGDSLFAHLYPQYNPKQSPVISGKRWLTKGASNEVGGEGLSGFFPFPELPQSPEGIGSNNWALAGSKTASGSPLLSNDPHLSLTLPSIWYEVHIVAGAYNFYGVSLPSLPSILIGFNAQTAWGITNVGQDVLDWYRIEWADQARTSYWLDGEAVAVEEVVDTVWVRGEDSPVIVRTPWTIFGPVVYDQPDDAYYNLAMCWVAHATPSEGEGDNIKAFVDLAKATTLDGYIEALRPFDSPGSNVVYANQNDIALTVAGRFPIRAAEQGRFVQDGTTRENHWGGFIPYEEVARDINPQRQFVASANQRSTDLSYPYYYLGSFDDYRGRYINRRITALSNATPEDVMALQRDAYSLKAEEVVPVMLQLLEGADLVSELRPGVDLLRQWDYRYTAEASAPILFNSWLDSLYHLTFDEVFNQAHEDYPVLYPETWRFIELLTDHPMDTIFDQQHTAKREIAADLVYQSYQQAATATLPRIAEGTNWSTHRGTSIAHLARIPGFGSGLLTTDGARGTPNALSAGSGPSWRMVVSLEEPLRAWGVLPGGSSGSIGSPFYMEGVAEWAQGDYHELELHAVPEKITSIEQLVFEKEN